MSTDAPDAGADSAYAAARTDRLSAGTIARYASGSLGTGGFATLPGLVLTYYLTDSLGVAALAAGAVITAAKVWDVVIDPVIGALTDRDLARHGTRRRLMLIGACTIAVLFALTFAVPPALGPVVGAIWVLIAFLLTATAFSLFQVPYIALPAELTAGYDERTRLLTWRVVVLTFSILLFGAGGPALRGMSNDPTTGYLVMGVVAGVVIAGGMLIATTVARRPVAASGAPLTEAALAEDRARADARALCRRHPVSPPQRAVPCAAVDLRAAGAGDRTHAGRGAVRRHVGDALRRRRAAAVHRPHRARADRRPRRGAWSRGASARSARSRSRASCSRWPR